MGGGGLSYLMKSLYNSCIVCEFSALRMYRLIQAKLKIFRHYHLYLLVSQWQSFVLLF